MREVFVIERIGFIGLGNMGRPMASNLARKGVPLVVFDVNPIPVRQLEQLGARPAADPPDVARDSEIVVTMLPDSASVDEVLLGGVASSVSAARVQGQGAKDFSAMADVLCDFAHLARPRLG